ncbi:MAG: hypothetical protein A2Z15_09365 [Chloroflexi bacterium RBG_16_50_11]|nr:MAG: hypothetical protein A2Z15_09365 [Chloroflexi bacterium RBG_16_50_11]
MKKRYWTAGLCLMVLMLLVSACGGGGSSTSATVATGNPETSTANPTTVSPTTAAKPTPTIPPGSLALFAVLSGSSQSDFLRVDDIRVNWDTTHFKLLRYIPGVQMLDEFGWTSSKSYSRSYIYGITAGGWLYVVKCFLDSGRKDISRLDPATGKTVASFGPVTTADMYEGFTICGDKVIYRTEVNKDLLGRRTSGGNVMVMKIGASSPVKVLDYYDDNNRGHYYSMGNNLVSIVTSLEGTNKYYDIYRVDPESLALGDVIYSFSSKNYVTFFEGDTALYWTETDTATGNIYVVRLPIDGNAVYCLEISDTIPQNLAIDESDGKLLVSFQDETPESPFYYLQDIASGDITEVDVEPAFFSKSKLGNGQFVILD